MTAVKEEPSPPMRYNDSDEDVCVSARLIDVIGVLTSVVKPCNL
jgi:hypothetical protein